MLELVEIVVNCSTKLASLQLVTASLSMWFVNRRLVIGLSPMLALPKWSSRASVIIILRKMLKRVGESRQLFHTPTVVLSQSQILLLQKTALVALFYKFTMALIKLLLILYILKVDQRA